MLKHLSQFATALALCFFVGAVALVGYQRVIRLLLPHARIQCGQPLRDLGKVSKGASIPCEFVVTNSGTRDLKIENVTPDCCSCTEILEYPRQPLAPGHEGTIRVNLLTKMLKGEVTKTCFSFSHWSNF